MHPFIHSFIRWFVLSFIVRSFVGSFIHCYSIHSFISTHRSPGQAADTSSGGDAESAPAAAAVNGTASSPGPDTAGGDPGDATVTPEVTPEVAAELDRLKGRRGPEVGGREG